MTTIPPAIALRAGSNAETLKSLLGPLAELPGTWVGSGFMLIALPRLSKDGPTFRLQVNATKEMFKFHANSAPVPDRGSLQHDIFYGSLRYEQNVSDAVTNASLHVENGMWLNVPATSVPDQGPTVVRQSVIPHGDSLLAQGTSLRVNKPEIQSVSPLPTLIGTGESPGEQYLAPYRAHNFPPGFDINNPNAALTAALEGQTFVPHGTVVLQVSTQKVGGILNIPFVTRNANALSLDATFWIEEVRQPDGAGSFLQLQYTQTIILQFEGINWPHITLATLLKQ